MCNLSKYLTTAYVLIMLFKPNSQVSHKLLEIAFKIFKIEDVRYVDMNNQ